MWQRRWNCSEPESNEIQIYLSLSKEGADKDGGHVKQERRMEQLYRKKKDKFLYLFLYIFVSYVLIFND